MYEILQILISNKKFCYSIVQVDNKWTINHEKFFFIQIIKAQREQSLQRF